MVIEAFDPVVKDDKPKKVYILPLSHPWKHAYLAKQKHRNLGAHV